VRRASKALRRQAPKLEVLQTFASGVFTEEVAEFIGGAEDDSGDEDEGYHDDDDDDEYGDDDESSLD
jgi:hypothetical protein